MSVVKLLLNPFRRFGGTASLLVALAVMACGVLVSKLTNSHFDGVIDLHASQAHPVSWTIALTEWTVDWLAMVVLLYIAGLVFSPSSIRLVDVAGMQGMARFPLIIAALVSALPVMDKLVSFAENLHLNKGAELDLSPVEIGLVVLIVTASIACIVWTVSLMYKAYSVSCNLKGTKAIVTFIAAFILAEILCKVIFTYLLR